jgi:hypothetical protein
MPFSIRIRPEDAHYDVFQRGNAFLVLANVGYDSDTDRTYSVLLGLEPLAGGDLEYFFCLIEADNVAGTQHEYWSGKDLPQCIDKPSRKPILNLVLRATKALLNATSPTRVQMSTWDAYLPDRAAHKHFLVARVFEMCGYEVRNGDPYHGKRVWWMERRIKADVGL